MRCVAPSVFEEVDKSAEDVRAEMGGGKDLVDYCIKVVAIAGNRIVNSWLVQVLGQSSSE